MQDISTSNTNFKSLTTRSAWHQLNLRSISTRCSQLVRMASQLRADFESLQQIDRQRRKNEALAQQIFGKNRRASAPGAGNKAKSGSVPSLASRIGVAGISKV